MEEVDGEGGLGIFAQKAALVTRSQISNKSWIDECITLKLQAGTHLRSECELFISISAESDRSESPTTLKLTQYKLWFDLVGK